MAKGQMECNYAARLSSCHTIGEKKTQQTWPATSKHCGGIVAINSRARRSPSVGRSSNQCGGGRRRRQARQPNPHGHGGRPLCFGVVVVVSVCEWGPPGSRTATTDDWDGKVYHNGVHRRLESCMAGRRDGSHFTVAGVSRPLLTPALRRRWWASCRHTSPNN